MIEFWFVEERFCHFWFGIEPADIDFDGVVLKNSAIGGDIRIFVAIPSFAPEDDEIDNIGDRLFSTLDIAQRNLPADPVVDEFGFPLDDKVGVVEVDLVL